MRIGVVTTSYPRWAGDSAGSFVEGHVRALRALGHDVEVVAAGEATPADRRDDDRRDDDRRDDDRRDDVVRVPARGLFYRGGAPDMIEASTARSLLAAAAFVPRFAATIALRARRWDHIIAHWLPSAIAALPARRPMTAIAHGGDIFTLRQLGLLQPALRALRGARVAFVAEHLRQIARVDGVVQPMGIDLAHFRALGRAPVQPAMILVAARLVPIKGVDVAIEAMAHLPGAQLVIAGDGPQRRALEARARNARVTFLGQVDSRRRDELLRAASVVVVPSRMLTNGRMEGCPTIALEALAAGVPVVATIGRACELVKPDDAGELARGIERALARPHDTYERVADLDWPAVAARLLRNE